MVCIFQSRLPVFSVVPLNNCSLCDLREVRTFSPWWDSWWSPKRQKSQVQKTKQIPSSHHRLSSPHVDCYCLCIPFSPLFQISCGLRSTRWLTAILIKALLSSYLVYCLWTRYTCWTSNASHTSTERWRAPSHPSSCSPLTGETV